jgi:hypothetical protein
MVLDREHLAAIVRLSDDMATRKRLRNGVRAESIGTPGPARTRKKSPMF